MCGGGGVGQMSITDVQVLFTSSAYATLAINIFIGMQLKLLTVSFLTSHFIAATSQGSCTNR